MGEEKRNGGYVYRCMYENTCSIHKHCMVLCTVKKIDRRMAVRIKCQERHGIITVQIGA